MKKALLVIALLSSSAFAVERDDPNVLFSTAQNYTTQVVVSWIPVDNVQARCEAESRKRKFGGFGYTVEACSFWDKDANGAPTCTVITAKNTTMWAVGHEMRHCFQGPWHK
jgi:hypothetical protein